MPKGDAFTKWLFERYLDFQREAGKSVTEKQFGEFIGLPKNVTNNLMHGRNQPSARNLALIDAKFPGAYEALGIPRPSAVAAGGDPRLVHVLRQWDELDEEQKRDIDEIVDRAKARNAKKTGGEVGGASDGKQ
jgi:hypothetical protein